tara:strand:+ start:4603 stop:4866 length:264 start_codon:yes stop_codon:yes gene_type:complete
MKRPNKKDYDFNDHFELLRFTKNLIQYTDSIELKSDLLNPVSKLFDDKINEINHQLNVSGFEGYHEFRKAQDEVRSLEVAKRVLNVC